MTDPIIMVGVPPILLAIIGGAVALALCICAGVNNLADRRVRRAVSVADVAAGTLAEEAEVELGTIHR